MREIKFRAWNKREREMVDLVTVGSRESDNNRTTWPALYFRKSDGVITGFDHEDYEVLQYTGLKDKNGVEIYEGDILEYYDLRKGVFIFKEQPKRREAIKWSKNDAQFRIPDMGFRLDTDKVELVGNIYEDPELIVGDDHGQTR